MMVNTVSVACVVIVVAVLIAGCGTSDRSAVTGTWVTASPHPEPTAAETGRSTATVVRPTQSASATTVGTTASELTRVNVRQGLFNREGTLGGANFSVLLPAGWSAVDEPVLASPGKDASPRGTIVLQGYGDMHIRYQFMVPENFESTKNNLFRVPDGYENESSMLNGLAVDWVLPVETTNSGGRYRISAGYSNLLGDDVDGFGLLLFAHSLSAELLDEAKAIMESVQFAAPPPAPPERPKPEVTPSKDWSRIAAHWLNGPSKQMFSVLAPPGWDFAPFQGADTFVGQFTDGEIVIAFDYGNLSGSAGGIDSHARNPDMYPAHEFWFETVDEKPLLFYRPVGDLTNERAYTGLSVERLPGSPVKRSPVN
jgi:hypothetical protein